MRRVLLLASIAVVPLAALVVHLSPGRDSARRVTPTFVRPSLALGDRTHIVQNQDEIRSLRRQLRELQNRAAPQPALTDPFTSAVEDSDDPAPPMDWEQVLEHNEQVELELQETLDTALAQETRDGAWALEREQSIVDAMATSEVLAEVSLVDIECRQTFCRAEMLHEGGPEAQDVLFAGLQQPPFTDGPLHAATRNGRAVVYLARAGRQLPR